MAASNFRIGMSCRYERHRSLDSMRMDGLICVKGPYSRGGAGYNQRRHEEPDHRSLWQRPIPGSWRRSTKQKTAGAGPYRWCRDRGGQVDGGLNGYNPVLTRFWWKRPRRLSGAFERTN
jgi:hypothetical protein